MFYVLVHKDVSFSATSDKSGSSTAWPQRQEISPEGLISEGFEKWYWTFENPKSKTPEWYFKKCSDTEDFVRFMRRFIAVKLQLHLIFSITKFRRHTSQGR